MNVRLKSLVQRLGLSEDAVKRMCDLTGDEAFVEQVLKDSQFFQAVADGLGVRYQDRSTAPEFIRLKEAPADRQPQSWFEASLKGVPYTPQAQKAVQPDAFAAAVQGANYSDMRPR